MVLQMQNIMYPPLSYQNSFTDLKLSSLIRLFYLPKLMVTTDLFTVLTSLSKAVGKKSFRDCPGGADGKESACNAGDLHSIPGLGRSP